jgi:hypothetical protein
MLEIVSRQPPQEQAGVFLGFDVLGVEYGGVLLHTFSCNDLTSHYVEKLE